MVDMGTAVWRGVADFTSLFKGQKQAGAGFDELGRKSDDAAGKGGGFGDKMSAGLQKVGGKMKTTGRDMTIGLTLPVVALGVKAVQSFSDFESSITAAGAKTGATADQVEQMKQVALEMGAQTKFSAGEAATAMDNMAAAGFDVNGVMAALPGVMLAAQASGEDLGMTADITAKAINAFGLEASDATHVADVFATAANTSAIDMLGLGQALAHAGQLGSSANQDLEDVVAVLGRLVDMGVPAASAGTGVRQAIQSLKSPSQKAQGYIADLGLSFRDVRGQMLPLPDLLDVLDKGLGDSNPKFVAQAEAAGMTENAYRDMAMQALFGVEGQQAMNLALSDGKPVIIDTQKETEKLAQLQKGLAKTMGEEGARAWIAARTNAGKFSASGAAAVRALGALNRASDGTSKKIGEIMSDTTKARLDQLGGAFETLAITLVTVLEPTLTKIVKGVTSAVNAFGKWAEAHPTLAKIVLVLVAILAAVGPLLIVLGMMATAIGAIAALGAPVIATIAIIIAAIAALIAIGILVYKNWDSIKAFLISVWQAISDFAVSVWNAIAGFFVGIWQWITDQATSIWGGVSGFFAGLWNGIKSVATSVWNAIAGFFTTIWNGIVSVARAVWGLIVAAVMLPVNMVKTGIMLVFNTLMAWWQAFWNVFGGLITAVWNLIVAIVRLGATLAFEALKSAWAGITGVVTGIWNAVADFLTMIWGRIKTGASEIWTAISKLASKVWGAISLAIQAVVKALVGWLVGSWNALKNAMQSVWNAIKSAAGAAWNVVQQVVLAPIRALWGLLSGPLGKVRDGIAAVWNTVKSGVSSAWTGISNAVKTGVDKVWGWVKSIKDKVVGFFSGAAKWLWDAGVKIIKGLIDGITSKIKDLTSKLNSITDKIPDWKGPAPVDRKLLFRSGQLIMAGLGRGIEAGKKGLRRTLGGVTMSIGTIANGTLGLPPGFRPPGAPPAAGAVAARPIDRGDAAGGGGNTYNVDVYNPVGETTAESVSKQVTRLAALGVAS